MSSLVGMLLSHMQAFADLSFWAIVACVSAAFIAGYVDAIAGGGGLIQLPVLLFTLPHTALATVLGTNKFSAVFGTSAAAHQFNKKLRVDRRVAIYMMSAAGVGSALGAYCSVLVDRKLFEPIIVTILIAVALFTLFRPDIGRHDVVTRWSDRLFVVVALGLVIGFYDGLIGPGTGTFLVFAIVIFLGQSFLRASGLAKFVNVMTNVAALCVFLPSGHVVWGLALVMAAANLLGGRLGVHSAIKRGSNFVRLVFMCVIATLVAKLLFS